MYIFRLISILFVSVLSPLSLAYADQAVVYSAPQATVTWPKSWDKSVGKGPKTRLLNEVKDMVSDGLLKAIGLMPPAWQSQITAQNIHFIIRLVPDLYPDLWVDEIDPNLTEQTPQHRYIFINPNIIFHQNLERKVAHEVFHLVHTLVNPGEVQWLREGLASYFEFIFSGDLKSDKARAAFIDPNTSLQGHYSFDAGELSLAQYGHNQLHIKYLVDQCGGLDLFWKISNGNYQGDHGGHNIDMALSGTPSNKSICSDFSSSAVAFELARIQNQSVQVNGEWTEDYVVFATTLNTKYRYISASQEHPSPLQLPTYQPLHISSVHLDSMMNACGEACKFFDVKSSYPPSITEINRISSGNFHKVYVIRTH